MGRFISCREHHDAWVFAWLAQAAQGLRPAQRLALFDQAFAVLFRRAHVTLGELTVSALVEKTLRDAAQTYPQLSTVKLDATGISLRALRDDDAATRDPRLSEALQFLMVELLTALGALTGETLTPLLHRELAMGGPSPDAGGNPREPKPS